MIIRALRLRHGRIALPRTFTPIQPQRRQQSSLEDTSSSAGRIESPEFVDVHNSTAQQQLDSIPSLRPIQLNDPNHPVAQDYAFFQHQKALTQHLGSSLAPHYRPSTLVNNPPSPKDITLELLLASQAHIGHATSLWNPANARYIFGVRGRKKAGESPIHIISLEATATHLRRACKVVEGITTRGGLVLFVGTREGQARAVIKAAELAKGCHLFTKWIPGSITNGQQILGRCATKVLDEFDQEVEGFEDQLANKAALKPDLVVCLNPLENYVLLHECGLNNIPTIGIIDTDANATWVTYPIPANDDSLRSVQVIAGVLGRAGEQGQVQRQRMAKDGLILYAQTHGLTTPSEAPASRKNRQATRPRQPRQLDASTAAATTAAEPFLPDEFTGVEIKQVEADQERLTQASSNPSENFPFNDVVFSAEDPLEEEIDLRERLSAVVGAEDTVYDDSPLDPSLTNESYSSDSPQGISEEDMNQFGGVEQLQSSTSSPSPIEQADDLAKELGESPEGESPLEQVEEVEKELGEQAQQVPDAPVGNPDVNGADLEDRAKYEAPVDAHEKEDGKKP